MTRKELRTRITNKLAKLSVNLPDIFPASEVNDAFLDALRGLPYKGVYREEKWTKTLKVDEKEYALPTDHLKVERVEVNYGSSTKEDYQRQQGWEEFGGELHLASSPSEARTMRVWSKKKFLEITDDTTALDVPDDKTEAVLLGAIRRLLSNLINYMIDSKNYDSIVKPSGATLPQVKSWRDEVRLEEERTIREFRTKPRPREMNLTT